MLIPECQGPIGHSLRALTFYRGHWGRLGNVVVHPDARQANGGDTTAEIEASTPVPGHKNYLISCDESGVHGVVYYGFGTLWMPWERRGDFSALVSELREKNRYIEEIKWTNVGRYSEPFYTDLIDAFFQRSWLMFHALVVRRGYSDKSFHKDFDEEKRKRFAMLVERKIAHFCAGDARKRYHVWVDPLPSRYKKADEAAFKIVSSMLKNEFGLKPLETLVTRRAKEVPGIQLADFLLGAALADWQNEATSARKLRVCRHLAKHLGWSDMRSDTHPSVWKFNLWYFYDPSTGHPREIPTRAVHFRLPIRPFRPRALAAR